MESQFDEGMNQLLAIISNKPGNMAIIISLAVSLIFAIIMWGAYRISHDQHSYHAEFGITLIILALISTVLMDLIQSNLALSLGMLGSLSIVRFRTNIKDYRDIGFIFWSMAIGIASATQSYMIVFLGSIILFGIMVTTKEKDGHTKPMLLVVRGTHADLDSIQGIVNTIEGKNQIKAKNILSDSFELVYEVEIKEKDTNGIIHYIFDVGGIDSVNLLAQNS